MASLFKWLDIYAIILLKSVCRSLQTAGRISCSIVSGDVSNCSYRLQLSCHEFASQFGLAILVRAKNTQNLLETGSPARVFIWMKRRPAIDRQRNRRKGALTPSPLSATDPSNSDNLKGDGGVRVRVPVLVRVRVRACVRAWCVCHIR